MSQTTVSSQVPNPSGRKSPLVAQSHSKEAIAGKKQGLNQNKPSPSHLETSVPPAQNKGKFTLTYHTEQRTNPSLEGSNLPKQDASPIKNNIQKNVNLVSEAQKNVSAWVQSNIAKGTPNASNGSVIGSLLAQGSAAEGIASSDGALFPRKPENRESKNLSQIC